VLAASGAGVPPAAANPLVTPVMTGLDNPRGLAFGPQGALYVAEAGRGGYGLTDPPCFIGQVGANRCYGPTGAISRLWHGVQRRIVTGLPSQAAAANGRNAIGPHDIAMLGVGSADVTIGWMQPPGWQDLRKRPEFAGFARLARFEPSGEWRFVADLGAYETDANPDNGPLDTNPYGLLAVPGGHLLTDAGGNSLVRVGASGALSTVAVFQSRASIPSRNIDSVPTSVATGPDGAYYVGELGGFVGSLPVPGAANIYRVAPDDPPPLFPLYRTSDACLGGFTTIIDIAFDKEGNLYLVQYATGTLIRITPDRDASGGICAQYRAGTPTTILTGLSQPTSVAVGPDGAVYVTNNGNLPSVGEVLRVEP
jgi:hypothetical protein